MDIYNMNKKDIEDLKEYVVDYYNNVREINDDFTNNELDKYGTILRLLYFVAIHNEIISKTLPLSNSPVAEEIISVNNFTGKNKKITLKYALLTTIVELGALKELFDINDEYNIVLNDKTSIDKALSSASVRFGTGRVF